MSQHAIENLIEDTVYLMDQSNLPDIDLRACFRKLYRIQDFYDTGYTHFRVMDILLKHGYVHRIPLEEHLDYASQKETFEQLEIPGWLPDTGGDSVYVEYNGDQAFLYFDAGGPLWERMCTSGKLPGSACHPLRDIGIPKVVRIVLEEAQRQGEKRLLTDWYGFLVKSYAERVFDREAGFPQTLAGLLGNEDCLAARKIAQDNGVKRIPSADEDVQLPRLSEELDMTNDVEEQYTLRFFLDLRKTPEVLSKGYEKAKLALQKATERAQREKAIGASVLDKYVRGRLGQFLSAKGWHTGVCSRENTWLWYRDSGDDRLFIWFDFSEELKILRCHQGMQQGLLLQWQQKEPDTEVHHLHFYRDIQAGIPNSWMEGNKHVHHFGGWKFDPLHSKKVLESHIDSLEEALEIVGEKYFDYLRQQFPVLFFEQDPERLLYLLEEGDDETGIIPDHVLFDSPYSILSVFAYHHALNGYRERADQCISKIPSIYANRTQKSIYITRYVEPFLEQWKAKGVAAPLLPLYHIHLHMALKDF